MGYQSEWGGRPEAPGGDAFLLDLGATASVLSEYTEERGVWAPLYG